MENKIFCRRLHRGDDLLFEIKKLAKEDLSVIGGHLVEGCIINTTCELVIQETDGWKYEREYDNETGYNEIVFVRN